MTAPTPNPARRVRRARREDVPQLLPWMGGPDAGRRRALRRMQASLASDLYVLEADGALRGVVAVGYRRSLAHGGLVATIDALRLSDDRESASGSAEPVPGANSAADAAASSAAGEPAPDIEILLDCALHRARRRGCVSIDSLAPHPALEQALAARGFAPAVRCLARSLRAPDSASPGSHEGEGEP